MNWDAIGAAGEWAGAITVAVTLIYLAKQVRQQNRIAEYNAWQSLMDGFNQTNLPFSTNTELNGLIARGAMEPDSLTNDEASQFQFMVRIYYNHMLKAYRAKQNGFLGEREWADMAGAFAQQMKTPGGMIFRKGESATFPDFWRAIDEHTDAGTRVDYSFGRTYTDNSG